MKRTLLLTLLIAIFSSAVVMAQEVKPEKDFARGWYIGAQAGMPMAEADFSSFGADKFRPGWSAGINRTAANNDEARSATTIEIAE